MILTPKRKLVGNVEEQVQQIDTDQITKQIEQSAQDTATDIAQKAALKWAIVFRK